MKLLAVVLIIHIVNFHIYMHIYIHTQFFLRGETVKIQELETKEEEEVLYYHQMLSSALGLGTVLGTLHTSYHVIPSVALSAPMTSPFHRQGKLRLRELMCPSKTTHLYILVVNFKPTIFRFPRGFLSVLPAA